MYAPPGVDSESSGEETTPPPTPPPPKPPRRHFKFTSLFSPTQKLGSPKKSKEKETDGNDGNSTSKDKNEELSVPAKKSVRIFAGELQGGQKGSQMEGLTTTKGESVAVEPSPLIEVKEKTEAESVAELEAVENSAKPEVNEAAVEVLTLLRKLVAETHKDAGDTKTEDSVTKKAEGAIDEKSEMEKVKKGEALQASKTNELDKLQLQALIDTESKQHSGKNSSSNVATSNQPFTAPPAGYFQPIQHHGEAEKYFASFSPPSRSNAQNGQAPQTAPPHGFAPAGPYSGGSPLMWGFWYPSPPKVNAPIFQHGGMPYHATPSFYPNIPQPPWWHPPLVQVTNNGRERSEKHDMQNYSSAVPVQLNSNHHSDKKLRCKTSKPTQDELLGVTAQVNESSKMAALRENDIDKNVDDTDNQREDLHHGKSVDHHKSFPHSNVDTLPSDDPQIQLKEQLARYQARYKSAVRKYEQGTHKMDVKEMKELKMEAKTLKEKVRELKERLKKLEDVTVFPLPLEAKKLMSYFYLQKEEDKRLLSKQEPSSETISCSFDPPMVVESLSDLQNHLVNAEESYSVTVRALEDTGLGEKDRVKLEKKCYDGKKKIKELKKKIADSKAHNTGTDRLDDTRNPKSLPLSEGLNKLATDSEEHKPHTKETEEAEQSVTISLAAQQPEKMTSTSKLEVSVSRYKAAYEQAIKVYKQDGLSEDDRKTKKALAKRAERKLQEAMEALQKVRKQSSTETQVYVEKGGKIIESFTLEQPEMTLKVSSDVPQSKQSELSSHSDVKAIENPTRDRISTFTSGVGKGIFEQSSAHSSQPSVDKLNGYLTKYQSAYTEAVTAYELSADENEKRNRKENMMQAESNLKEAIQSLETVEKKDEDENRVMKETQTEAELGVGADTENAIENPVVEAQERHQPVQRQTVELSKPIKDEAFVPDLVHSPIVKLEAYASKYKADYDRADKAYLNENLSSDERKEKKAEVQRAESILKEATQALDSLKEKPDRASREKDEVDVIISSANKQELEVQQIDDQGRQQPLQPSSKSPPIQKFEYDDRENISNDVKAVNPPDVSSHSDSISRIQAYVTKYQQAYSQAAKACKQGDLDDNEMRKRKDQMGRIKSKLREATEALHLANNDQSKGKPIKQKDEGINWTSDNRKHEQSLPFLHENPKHATGNNSETQSASNINTEETSESNKELKRLEKYILKYKDDYSEALKAYKDDRLSGEGKMEKKGELRVAESRLREVMQAMDKIRRENCGKCEQNQDEQPKKLDKGKGKALQKDVENDRTQEYVRSDTQLKKADRKSSLSQAELPLSNKDQEKLLRQYQARYNSLMRCIKYEGTTARDGELKLKEIDLVKAKIKQLMLQIKSSPHDRNTKGLSTGLTDKEPKSAKQFVNADQSNLQELSDGNNSSPRNASGEPLESSLSKPIPKNENEMMLISYRTRYESLRKIIENDDQMTAHDRELKIKEVDHLKKKIRNLTALAKSTPAKEKADVQCSDSANLPQSTKQTTLDCSREVINTEMLIQRAKSEYTTLLKLSKDENLSQEERKKIKQKAQLQARAIKKMIEKVDERQNKENVAEKRENENLKKRHGHVTPETLERVIEQVVQDRTVDGAIEEVQNQKAHIEEIQVNNHANDSDLSLGVDSWAPLQISKDRSGRSKYQPDTVVQAPNSFITQCIQETPVSTGNLTKVTWSQSLVSLSKCIDLGNTILHSIKTTTPDGSPLGALITRLVSGLLMQRDLVDSMRRVVGDGHDEQLIEFVEHLDTVKIFLEQISSSKRAEGEDIERETRRGQQLLETVTFKRILDYVTALTEFLTPGMIRAVKMIFDEFRDEGFNMKSIIHAALTIRKEITLIHDAKDTGSDIEQKKKTKGLIGVLDMFLEFISPNRHQLGVGIHHHLEEPTPHSKELLTSRKVSISPVKEEMTSPSLSKDLDLSPKSHHGHSLSNFIHRLHHKSSSHSSPTTPTQESINRMAECRPGDSPPVTKPGKSEISHAPIKLPPATQRFLDGASDCQKTSPSHSFQFADRIPIESSKEHNKPPPLAFPLHSGSTGSDISPSRMIHFPASSVSPTFEHDLLERDLESSPSKYSQSSAASTATEGTVRSDRQAAKLLAFADSGPKPVHCDSRDDVDGLPDDKEKQAPTEEEVHRAEKVMYPDLVSPPKLVRPPKSFLRMGGKI
ncbi:hypothetical protein L204_104549 [Cryptococcus depauperatus]|nr:hypothetical protein L204_03410 [Cryptococcus depauperatus CBS 7855]